MSNKQVPEYPNPFAMWEPVMEFWFKAMFAGTQQAFQFWAAPFGPPPAEEREEEGDLDVPGPFERDFEDSLHA
ncbi:hypothetical protein [Erythrobacter sp. HL-111]|uniref:hypothetical protein n=1 Tax=Erythrobacter sp. HL-111 TaxID=1798193 RepID=UPI0006D95D92|nr:hypothetical protein [Erythrobacter sp. HL-111]KPP88773.1 MAG: hypothetical protein HLUCCO15_11160 [Erythrobacteraceae bacterium HL-111]SDR96158.1 hypothetical protein SAMN04515621_0711 [Erythrobacter sp. HL-111]